MADLIRLLLAGGVPIRGEGCMLSGDEAEGGGAPAVPDPAPAGGLP